MGQHGKEDYKGVYIFIAEAAVVTIPVAALTAYIVYRVLA